MLNLPKYNPNNEVWKAIENELDNYEKIQSLNEYAPSEKVWKAIEMEQRNGKILSIKTWSRIAAAIIFIFGVAYLLNLTKPLNNNSATITYSEVWIDPIQSSDWNLEEDQNIVLLIEQKENESPYLLKSEEYQTLKEEYLSLLDSKQLILNEVNPYNENVELELILTRLELEKSSIARSLITFNAT